MDFVGFRLHVSLGAVRRSCLSLGLGRLASSWLGQTLTWPRLTWPGLDLPGGSPGLACPVLGLAGHSLGGARVVPEWWRHLYSTGRSYLSDGEGQLSETTRAIPFKVEEGMGIA